MLMPLCWSHIFMVSVTAPHQGPSRARSSCQTELLQPCTHGSCAHMAAVPRSCGVSIRPCHRHVQHIISMWTGQAPPPRTSWRSSKQQPHQNLVQFIGRLLGACSRAPPHLQEQHGAPCDMRLPGGCCLQALHVLCPCGSCTHPCILQGVRPAGGWWCVRRHQAWCCCVVVAHPRALAM
jgi:hypothetical protein